MDNRSIARAFLELADLMELHGENAFKIRSYRRAYQTLRNLPQPLSEMSRAQMLALPGIGSAIADKIAQLLETGQMKTLERFREMTPPGLRELLAIKGLGPKKLRTIWYELQITSPGELLYAIEENRLLKLKGFGKKTQDDWAKKLNYYLRSKGRFLYAVLEPAAEAVLQQWRRFYPEAPISLAGSICRKAISPRRITCLIGNLEMPDALFDDELFQFLSGDEHEVEALWEGEFPVRLYFCKAEEFGSKLFLYTGDKDFVSAFAKRYPGVSFKGLEHEEEVFERANLPYIPPELREGDYFLERIAAQKKVPELLEWEDFKGAVHVHTTYSDGAASLRQMAERAREMGLEYLGVSDHSRAAFYANGLQAEEVDRQQKEIDALNAEMAPFRIFKGIECDILNDGSLDYDEAVLATFDFVIASVHSNLRMDEEQATRRLLKAIRHPATRILGHPTGRLLLSRPPYPLRMEELIAACAEEGVAIEINANPYRLDLDWHWVPLALEKGVKLMVNPDAHSLEGLKDMRYGMYAARKGGLGPKDCLNCLSANDFAAWCQQKRSSGR